MSAYQYYEFAAVDRPLDGRQLDELRALSTRADITSTSFVNSYNWGSFRGDPRRMMEGGEGALASILPVRAEIMSGDFRPLYLLWLVGVQAEQLDGDELEPPVPAGLRVLTGSQTALAEFLRLDVDLIAAAAASSEPALPPGPGLDAWVASLAARERDALLVELLRGDDPHLRAATLRRADASRPGEGRRTVRELLSAAEIRRDARLTAERIRREAAAAERERVSAAVRERRLAALRAEGEGAWRRIAALVATKKPAEYDRAVDLLADLRDACTKEEFARRISELRDEHCRKPSLMDRLDKAGL